MDGCFGSVLLGLTIVLRAAENTEVSCQGQTLSLVNQTECLPLNITDMAERTHLVVHIKGSPRIAIVLRESDNSSEPFKMLWLGKKSIKYGTNTKVMLISSEKCALNRNQSIIFTRWAHFRDKDGILHETRYRAFWLDWADHMTIAAGRGDVIGQGKVLSYNTSGNISFGAAFVLTSKTQVDVKIDAPLNRMACPSNFTHHPERSQLEENMYSVTETLLTTALSPGSLVDVKPTPQRTTAASEMMMEWSDNSFVLAGPSQPAGETHTGRTVWMSAINFPTSTNEDFTSVVENTMVSMPLAEDYLQGSMSISTIIDETGIFDGTAFIDGTVVNSDAAIFSDSVDTIPFETLTQSDFKDHGTDTETLSLSGHTGHSVTAAINTAPISLDEVLTSSSLSEWTGLTGQPGFSSLTDTLLLYSDKSGLPNFSGTAESFESETHTASSVAETSTFQVSWITLRKLLDSNSEDKPDKITKGQFPSISVAVLQETTSFISTPELISDLVIQATSEVDSESISTPASISTLHSLKTTETARMVSTSPTGVEVNSIATGSTGKTEHVSKEVIDKVDESSYEVSSSVTLKYSLWDSVDKSSTQMTQFVVMETSKEYLSSVSIETAVDQSVESTDSGAKPCWFVDGRACPTPQSSSSAYRPASKSSPTSQPLLTSSSYIPMSSIPMLASALTTPLSPSATSLSSRSLSPASLSSITSPRPTSMSSITSPPTSLSSVSSPPTSMSSTSETTAWSSSLFLSSISTSPVSWIAPSSSALPGSAMPGSKLHRLGSCRCVQQRPVSRKQAEKEKQQSVEAIVSALYIPTANMSATVRKKTSAVDDRKSSIMIGCLWAMVSIVPLVSVLVADVIKLVQHLCTRMT